MAGEVTQTPFPEADPSCAAHRCAQVWECETRRKRSRRKALRGERIRVP